MTPFEAAVAASASLRGANDSEVAERRRVRNEARAERARRRADEAVRAAASPVVGPRAAPVLAASGLAAGVLARTSPDLDPTPPTHPDSEQTCP